MKNLKLQKEPPKDVLVEMKCLECDTVIGYSVSTNEEFTKDYMKCPQSKASRDRGCKFL